MRHSMGVLGLGAILCAGSAGLAAAQPYYPPPGYGGPPRHYHEEAGWHCEAFIRTPEGPRRRFCRTGRPLPVGSYCECLGPEPPPGYPPYPPARGHVVE